MSTQRLGVELKKAAAVRRGVGGKGADLLGVAASEAAHSRGSARLPQDREG